MVRHHALWRCGAVVASGAPAPMMPPRAPSGGAAAVRFLAVCLRRLCTAAGARSKPEPASAAASAPAQRSVIGGRHEAAGRTAGAATGRGGALLAGVRAARSARGARDAFDAIHTTGREPDAGAYAALVAAGARLRDGGLAEAAFAEAEVRAVRVFPINSYISHAAPPTAVACPHVYGCAADVRAHAALDGRNMRGVRRKEGSRTGFAPADGRRWPLAAPAGGMHACTLTPERARLCAAHGTFAGGGRCGRQPPLRRVATRPRPRGRPRRGGGGVAPHGARRRAAH